MKRILLLAAAFCLLTIPALAQTTIDFSGNWVLDPSESKLGPYPVKAMSLSVAQTGDELKVERNTSFKNEEGKLTDTALTEIYKAEGAVSVIPVGSLKRGEERRQIRFLKNSRLELTSVIAGAQGGALLTREEWKLSKDGQKLIIEQVFVPAGGIGPVDLSRNDHFYKRMVFERK